jgi:predicted ester cyclase
MSAAQNKAIVQRWLEELNNRHNLAVIDELVAESVVGRAPMAELHGREHYRQICAATLQATPDLHCVIEELIAEGDTVAVRYTATCSPNDN